MQLSGQDGELPVSNARHPQESEQSVENQVVSLQEYKLKRGRLQHQQREEPQG